MQKKLLIAAAISGFLAVVLGAFGAHGLKPLLTEHQLSIYEKGIAYQFYHTLAALLVLVYYQTNPHKQLLSSALCFLIGIVLFSGSLYLLATNDMNHLPTLLLGPITPVGGVFFLVGWGLLLSSLFLKNEDK